MTARTPIFAAALALSALPCSAQPKDAAPAEPTQLLKQLSSLEKKHEDAASAELNRLMGILGRGAAGGAEAAQLYEDAVKSLRFEGRKDSARSAADWSKNNAELLRSEEMRSVVRLHLQYLLMALQHGKGPGANSSQLADASLRYTKDLTTAIAGKDMDRAPKEVQQLLSEPIDNSIFSRWLELGQYLPDKQDWEQVPGDVEGILEINVRGPWRTAHDPRVPETWDLQISLLEATPTTDAKAQANWKNVALPRLLFGRASDRIACGQRNLGIREIMDLVGTYPLHPDFKTWAGKLREVVQPLPSSSPQPAAPAASATPAP